MLMLGFCGFINKLPASTKLWPKKPLQSNYQSFPHYNISLAQTFLVTKNSQLLMFTTSVLVI